MNSCSQGRTLQQVNNTCWFHTAVNGFLFSRRGRQILWDAYREYKGPLKPSNTCSKRGVLPLDQFWAFVIARLEKRPVSTSETNVIHELRPYSDISSGNGTDVVILCQKVFGQVNLFGMAHRFEEWRISKSKIVSGAMIGILNTVYTDFDDSVVWDDHGKETVYDISHVYIALQNPEGSGHAITGYTCKGVKYIYDSNFTRSKKLNWKNKNALYKYCMQIYGYKPELVYTVVYIS
jgi:hypothetical protein